MGRHSFHLPNSEGWSRGPDSTFTWGLGTHQMRGGGVWAQGVVLSTTHLSCQGRCEKYGKVEGGWWFYERNAVVAGATSRLARGSVIIIDVTGGARCLTGGLGRWGRCGGASW